MIVKSLLVPASIFAEVKSGCSPVITPPAVPIPPVEDTGSSTVDIPPGPGIVIGGGGGFVPYPNNEATPEAAAPVIPDNPAANDGLGGSPAASATASSINFCAVTVSSIIFCDVSARAF